MTYRVLRRPRRSASLAQVARYRKQQAEALTAIGVGYGDAYVVGRLEDADRAKARSTDPDTSHEAAASVGDLRDNQAAVLKVFQSWGVPMDDQELLRRYETGVEASFLPPQSPSGIRSRRKELVRGGLLVNTGEKVLSGTGRRMILWGLPE